MIPLIDLSIPKSTQSKIGREISSVIKSKSFILGKRLETFESKFAKYLGCKYAIGVATGTDALRISLRALGIGNGDKVLTVSFTSPFTAIAILEEGAIPVFCDIDELTYTIDLKDAEKKITNNVKAIMPVHIYGNPARMDEVAKFAKKYKLKIVEDACQAHGASFGGKKVGTLGDVGAFSFYPTKNLGAFGDGGMVVTNNKKLAQKIYLLRHGGQSKRFWHKENGINSRLDELQAAILNIKLIDLEKNNLKRAKLATRYKQKLSDLPITFQGITEGAQSAYHLFTLRTKKRDKLLKYISAGNIGCDVYYPYPIHLQPLFRKSNAIDLPVTQLLDSELLAIPISPTLSFKQQDQVIKRIRNFFKK